MKSIVQFKCDKYKQLYKLENKLNNLYLSNQ